MVPPLAGPIAVLRTNMSEIWSWSSYFSNYNFSVKELIKVAMAASRFKGFYKKAIYYVFDRHIIYFVGLKLFKFTNLIRRKQKTCQSHFRGTISLKFILSDLVNVGCITVIVLFKLN